jgi:hypothetical protein
MREGRDQALRDFRLVDEMPFCREETLIEDITSCLDRVRKRRVDQGILQRKKRRFISKPGLEKKAIDDVIVKLLMRFCNAVEDCFSFEHQAANLRKQATARRISRTVRDSKAKQLYRRKILNEVESRTGLRQRRIESAAEAKIHESTAAAISTRHEILRASKEDKTREILGQTEDAFMKVVEHEDASKQQKINQARIARRAKIDLQRKLDRERLVGYREKLRRHMDVLDSAADRQVVRLFGTDL